METTTVTTSATETNGILKAPPREELAARLSPERRALYERISERRERIGPVEHDLVTSLRELRENG
jgi:hypothetical protein